MSTNNIPQNTIGLNKPMFQLGNGNKSAIEILAANTYVQNDYQQGIIKNTWHYCKNKIYAMFGGMDDTQIYSYYKQVYDIADLKKSLEVAATCFTLNPNSKIYIVDDLTNFDGSKYTKGICYQDHPQYDNSIFLLKDMSMLYTDFRGVFIHELWHFNMNCLFDNGASPFYRGDENAKTEYYQAITYTLLNVAKELNNNITNSSSSYKVGNELESENRDNLVEILLYDQIMCLLSFDDDCVIEEFQQIDAISDFLNIYNPNFYAAAKEADQQGIANYAEEAEFLVRYPQQLAKGGDEKYLTMFKPIDDFITNNIDPIMDKYLAEHMNLVNGTCIW
jgi:hypothetical protein